MSFIVFEVSLRFLLAIRMIGSDILGTPNHCEKQETQQESAVRLHRIALSVFDPSSIRGENRACQSAAIEGNRYWLGDWNCH